MKKLLYAFGLGMASLSAQAQAPVKPFQAKDRVIFVGNSITEAGAYVSYVYLYYMTHFPGRPLVIMNGGVGGDRAAEMYRRLDYDVMAKHPNVLVLTFGMNDTGYFEFNQANADETAQQRIAASAENYGKIEARLKAMPNVTKILMSSPPYDEISDLKGDVFRGKSKAMLKIAEFQEASAKKNNWGFVDLLRPLTAINERLLRQDPTSTGLGHDRIHPGNAGHLIMAAQFLKDQGLAGKPVADFSVDAAGKVAKAENCKLSNVTHAAGKVSFDYLAESLPFPLDTVPRIFGNPQKQIDALQVIPFAEEFDKEMITVPGLEAGTYSLLMDGHKVGEWDAAAFAAGINLALQGETPEYKQAQSIMQLNIRRQELEARFRSYYWVQADFMDKRGLRLKDNAAALDSARAGTKTDVFLRFHEGTYETAIYPEMRAAWQHEIDTIIALVYKLNKPATHHIEIVKN